MTLLSCFAPLCRSSPILKMVGWRGGGTRKSVLTQTFGDGQKGRKNEEKMKQRRKKKEEGDENAKMEKRKVLSLHRQG